MADLKIDISKSIYSLGKGLGIVFLVMAILSFLILLLPFFLPNVFDYQTLGSLGDTVGGFLNPLIAIAAALLTFLAFFIQYKANQYQKKSIEIQQKDIEVARFENNFFEMIRLHKENINEMKITGYDLEISTTLQDIGINSKETISRSRSTRMTEGRKVFVTMIRELFTCYQICKHFKNELSDEVVKKKAFQIFFFGINSEFLDISEFDDGLMDAINKIRKRHYDSHGAINRFRIMGGTVINENDVLIKSGELIKLYIKYRPFSGHENRLGHYYRLLFSCVNFVVESEKKGLFKYQQSRHYLKILRSQLSNDEQLMLYYNYYLGAGKEWDKLGKRGNRFLTKYRMLHNIPIDKVKIVESPREHFKNYISNHMEILKSDPLFEWGDVGQNDG